MWLYVKAILLALCTATMLVNAVKVQSASARANPSRAETVKETFQDAFNDYLKYAAGYDALRPLTKDGENYLGGWGATYVDAMTTAHVMGLDGVVAKGITFISTVDFTKTNATSISLFETNIRYVGGMLSLYELTGQQNQILVDQAKVIGDRLMNAWIDGHDIPFNTLLNWSDAAGPRPDTSKNAIIAEAGTLLLELDRLSKYTGNDTYRQRAVKSMDAVIQSKAIEPGLYGQGIDPRTNKPTDDYMTWGGGSDSFFEYLIKYGQLIGSTQTYVQTWVESVKSSIRCMLIRPGQTSANLTYLTDYSPSNGGQIPQFSHLGCFVGGNWILGGRLLDSEAVVDYGLALAQSCINTYTSSVTGIGPEVYVFKTQNGGTNGVTINDETFYQLHGFDYSVVDYVLRPEVMESVFYAYRATGDTRWQDLAWQAFLHIRQYCKAPAALAAIQAVNSTSTEQINDSESFMYAELFKYLYLIFDDPSRYSLDQYVFNTEAHPFRVDNVEADYSSASFGTLPLANAGPSRIASQPTKGKPVPRPLISSLPDALLNIL